MIRKPPLGSKHPSPFGPLTFRGDALREVVVPHGSHGAPIEHAPGTHCQRVILRLNPYSDGSWRWDYAEPTRAPDPCFFLPPWHIEADRDDPSFQVWD